MSDLQFFTAIFWCFVLPKTVNVKYYDFLSHFQFYG